MEDVGDIAYGAEGRLPLDEVAQVRDMTRRAQETVESVGGQADGAGMSEVGAELRRAHGHIDAAYVALSNAAGHVRDFLCDVGVSASEHGNAGVPFESRKDYPAHPGLGTFMSLLSDPGYHPPEFAYDQETGSFTVPGGLPPAKEGTERIILRVDYTTSEGGFAEGKTDPNNCRVWCIDDATGERLQIPGSGLAAFSRRMGRRKIAVDLRRGEQNKAEVTAVYGVEPLFYGDPDQLPPGDNVLIEGKVVRYDPAVDMGDVFGGAERPLPMMEVMLRDGDPPKTVWVPVAGMDNMTGMLRDEPLSGDVVQVRIASSSQCAEMPGYGRGVVTLAYNLTGKYYSTVPSAYVMRAGPRRQAEAARRGEETERLTSLIETSDDPAVIARAVAEYLQGRYDTRTSLMLEGLVKWSGFNMESGEIERITAAARRLDPDDMPVILHVATYSSSLGSSPYDHRMAKLTRLGKSEAWQRLQPGVDAVTMTTGQAVQAAVRVVDEQLLNMEPLWSVKRLPLGHVLELLDEEGADRAVDAIRERLEDAPRHHIFITEIMEMINATIAKARRAPRYNIMQMVCEAARAQDDLEILHEHGILADLIHSAGNALLCRNPAFRERQAIPDEQFREHMKVAYAVRDMFARAGNIDEQLGADQQRILADLAQLEG